MSVMCLSTSIGKMPDETEVTRAFRSMYRILNKGGILVLTQGTTDRQWGVCVIDYLDKGTRYNILDIFHNNEVTDFKVWRSITSRFS